jgi:alpha-amylase
MNINYSHFGSYYPLIRALSASGSFVDLATEMTSLQGLCNVRSLRWMRWILTDCEQDTTVMGSFSENHDQPRFASYTSDISVSVSGRRMHWRRKTNVQKLAKNVLAYTILADGIPIGAFLVDLALTY